MKADVRDYTRLAARTHTAPARVRKESARAIQDAVRPVRREVAASARARLPRRGGLGAWVAGARVDVRQVERGDTVGVEIKSSRGSHNLAAIDAGTVRHPTWGRKPIHVQSLRPNYFTDVMTGPVARRARAALTEALAQAMRESGTP